MGNPSESRDFLSRVKSYLFPNVLEGDKILLLSVEERSRLMKQHAQEGLRAGAKAGAVACVASAVTTLVAVRTIPWAKANLNYTKQAQIISAASVESLIPRGKPV